jgi:hypothetical protein
VGSSAQGHAEPGEPHDQRSVTAWSDRDARSAPARPRCHPWTTGRCSSVEHRTAEGRVEADDGRDAWQPRAVEERTASGSPARARCHPWPTRAVLLGRHGTAESAHRRQPTRGGRELSRNAWLGITCACSMSPVTTRPVLLDRARVAAESCRGTRDSASTLRAASRRLHEQARALALAAATRSIKSHVRISDIDSRPARGPYPGQYNSVACGMLPPQRRRDMLEGRWHLRVAQRALRHDVRKPDITVRGATLISSR